MKIAITFDLSDWERRGIANSIGEDGLASYTICRDWIVGMVRADLETVASEVSDGEDGDDG